MSSPIEIILDAVEWKEMPDSISTGEQAPQLYATHEGIMTVGDFEFKVYQLNNGQRVIAKESMEAFFGHPMEEVLGILKDLGS